MTCLSVPSTQPEPTSRAREALPADNPPSAVRCSERDSSALCKTRHSLTGREARERVGKNTLHGCSPPSQEASRIGIPLVPPRGQLLPPRTSRKGLAPGSGPCLQEGVLCCYYPGGNAPQHGRERRVPAPAVLKRGPGVVYGSRKSSAVLPRERRWPIQVTAEVTFQLMALLKLNQKGNTAPFSLREVLGASRVG